MAASRSLHIYLFLSYVLPLFYYFWLNDRFLDRYTIEPISISFLMINVFVVLLITSVRSGNFKDSAKRIYLGKGWFLLFSLFFLFVSISFFIRYDISFRHTSRISDGGALIYSLYLMRSLAIYAVLRVIIATTNGVIIRRYDKLSVLLIALGLLLTTTSSLQVLEFLMALFALKANAGNLNKRFSLIGAMKISVPALLVVAMVIYFGIANKLGFKEAFVFITHSGSELIKNSLLRVSTSFVSGSFSSLGSFQNYLDLSIIEKIYSTFLYRVQLLLPFVDIDVGGGYLNTVNRMNYLNISTDTSLEKAGASPGLIGSFLYLPLYPISLLAVCLYSKILISRIDCLFKKEATPSVLVLVCILIFLRPLLESPLSIFVVIDPVFFAFLILVIGPLFKGKQ